MSLTNRKEKLTYSTLMVLKSMQEQDQFSAKPDKNLTKLGSKSNRAPGQEILGNGEWKNHCHMLRQSSDNRRTQLYVDLLKASVGRRNRLTLA